MPNHFHCIIENVCDGDGVDGDGTVGATLCGRPVQCDRPVSDTNAGEGAHAGAPLQRYGPHNKRIHATVNDAMDWLKTMTTNAYIQGVKQQGWQRYNRKLWQRDYWEHIIRSLEECERISEYIINNPGKWRNDTFYNDSGKP